MKKVFSKDFSPERANIDMCEVDYVWGDTSDQDKVSFLCSLVKNKFSNKRLLEIGTYRGVTSCNIVKNLDSGHLYTCDCTYEVFEKYLEKEQDEHGNKISYIPYNLGSVYKSHLTEQERGKLTQLIGDTRDLNFQQELVRLSPFDLIYIDASHTREGIKNDTELALDLMSQNGTIIWDDYNGWWAGVDEYLDELALSEDLIYLLDNRYVILSLDK